MIGNRPIMTPCTIHKVKAHVEITYVRLEIASVSVERQALSNCGTKLKVVKYTGDKTKRHQPPTLHRTLLMSLINRASPGWFRVTASREGGGISPLGGVDERLARLVGLSALRQ
jgi:hypothetical protein